ncbi:fructose-6-phosphate aldolase [Enterococcus malodoratus]|uniref:Fructose-6-phosphate aldolase n=1 Tax=Enterococcus malodoratus ATCC 43197 TaxID=1158601 RepID=R2R525_9ENTE|nr:fructose-6-phosphate aldolase [Enterococcus malodoratus]EOH75701.1 fructose-6-phosphate aldolase [Enterococcus malodoratus ATCC 43197]EOT67528.1 fructose-6-phosphate aldolase [Enterococcus malodoratus ATCC 43197]SPX03450.1 Transaldolase [Enterococcus malodoratus]STD69220.1 Transaldolase [Enterococcus malodoratus]
MEYMLDTVCLDSIENYMDVVPIRGVTSTPSIIKREGKIDFFPHMKRTLEIIGNDRTLHMQVVAKELDGMVDDARKIWTSIGEEVFVKIPASKAGLNALNILKKENEHCRITTSAVYTKLQAFLALESGADYIAIYTNRSENIGIDPFDIISSAKEYARRNTLDGKIMASSIKNIMQITEAIDSGADAVTFSPEVLEAFFDLSATKQAIDHFTNDWKALYQTRSI